MRAPTALLLTITGLAIMPAAWSETREELARQVRDAENGFAATMAARDFSAFQSFLAEDAVFFGDKSVARGKAAVAAEWKNFYEGEAAKFSWQSEHVEVLDSGNLAYSSGPVMDPRGKRVGTFNSVWRREADGEWKVVFDKGCSVCDCAKKD